MKIKELYKDGPENPEIHIDDVALNLGVKKEVIREYLTALSILDFIKYTDHTKEVFVLTGLG